MSKRDSRVINLADFKDKKKQEGSLEIELSDGTKIHIDAPEIWPDEAVPFIEAKDNIGLGRFLMGEENYDLFVADGGSSAMIGSMLDERHGATLGKSSASSDS